MGINTAPLQVRDPSLDVTRACALIGVVVMNFHAYLNKSDAFYPNNPSLAERIFNPLTGILSTRFAATFVLVAGIGISLLMRKAVASGDASYLAQVRLQIARRGLFLFILGSGIQWIWPGTIIFYYGAYFLIASVIATWSTRNMIILSLTSIAVSATVSAWRAVESMSGNPTRWLSPQPNSPRNLLIRVFIDYTHPVFPWITFLCAGILIGRSFHLFRSVRRQLAIWSAIVLGIVVVIRTVAYPKFVITTSDQILQRVLSTNNFEHGALYAVSALATAVLALCTVSFLVDINPTSFITNTLTHAGRMSLTIYVAHVLIFNFIVNWMHWISPSGLGTAMVLSLVFYGTTIPLAAWWSIKLGSGPLERVYRLIGG